MRLTWFMEWVVSFAAGFATTRIYQRRAAIPHEWVDVLDLVCVGSLPGIASTQLLFLAIEALRRKSPPNWGLGRWSWAIAGLQVVIQGTASFGPHYLREWMAGDKEGYPLIEGIIVYWQAWPCDVQWIVIAFYFASLLARLPRDAHPDAREWSGRIFLWTFTLSWFAANAYRMATGDARLG